MMEPVSDAFTMSSSPLRIAMQAMISSAALPKVAFSRPPIPSPVRSARCSVALPIQPASGITARQAATKVHVSRPAPPRSRMTAAGTKTSSQLSEGLSAVFIRGRLPAIV